MRPAAWLPAILFLLAAQSIRGQERSDSLRVTPPRPAGDSLRVPPAAPRDAAGPAPAPGASFGRKEIDWSDYNAIGSIAKNAPGVRMHELGEYGHPGYLSLFGSLPSHLSIVRGTETMNDLVTGVPDHNLIPVEEIDSVFVPAAHQAFYYGGNGRELAVVAREKEEDSPRPSSRIRHTEGPSDYLYTDVIFSVNTAPRSNFTAGLSRQSLGTAGGTSLTALDARYENSGYESWDLRGAYATRIAETLHLKVEDHYDHFIDMFNGGVDPLSASILNPDDAFGLAPGLANNTMRAEVVRNRIGAQARWDALADSLRPVLIDVSFLTGVRYFRDLLDRIDTLQLHLDEKTSWRMFSLSLRKSFLLSSLALDAGADVQPYRIRTSPILSPRSGWNTAFFSRAEWTLPFGAVEGLARAENNFSRSTLGFGATVRIPIGPELGVWAGASRSERSPSLFERGDAAQEGPNERLMLAEAGAAFRSGAARLEARAFLRDLAHGFLYTFAQEGNAAPARQSLSLLQAGDGDERRDGGAAASGSFKLWKLTLEGRISAAKKLSAGPFWDAPAARLSGDWSWWGSAALFFQGEVLEGALELKTGARAEFVSDDAVPGFGAHWGLYGGSAEEPSTAPVTSAYAAYARIDLFLFARVRTAILHFILENAADTRYVTAYFYPMPGRSIRFGVSWAFLD